MSDGHDQKNDESNEDLVEGNNKVRIKVRTPIILKYQIQAALIIRDLFICEFAYSRPSKFHQTS